MTSTTKEDKKLANMLFFVLVGLKGYIAPCLSLSLEFSLYFTTDDHLKEGRSIQYLCYHAPPLEARRSEALDLATSVQ